MAVTVTKQFTVEDAINKSNLNLLADALAAIELGTMLKAKKVEISQAASTSVALPVAALGPMAMVVRVTAGVSQGAYLVVDEDGIAVDVGAEIGVCKLSADGSTLTFASNVEECVVSYLAGPAVALDSAAAF